jgi:hypothetical protein
MTTRELGSEICDLFFAAEAFEQTGRYPEAIAAYDLATQRLLEFTAELNRPLDELCGIFPGPDPEDAEAASPSLRE